MIRFLTLVLLVVSFLTFSPKIAQAVTCYAKQGDQIITSIKSNETFDFYANGVDKNKDYILKLNNLVYSLDPRPKSDNDGDLKILNIQPEAIHTSFSENLVVSLDPPLGAVVCISTITVTNVAEPIAGNKCCDNSAYSYIESTNQCSEYLASLGTQTSSNCKQGDKCLNNVCYTSVEVKYYRCDTSQKDCTESIAEGQPNPLGATTDKTACDKSCIANGTTFASNAPAAIPPCKNGIIQGTTTPCTNAGGLGCWSSNGQLALGDGDGVMTALGCIPTEPTILVQNFLKFATGIGGAIALLLMIAGAFQMITSQGNPETVKKGQEQFTSAVIGLLFIIFSVLLLQVIGFDILQIPGFQ